MSGYLTTHVLDTASGKPAAGMKIELFRLTGDTRAHLASVTTNDDGRTDSPILPSEAFEFGDYELLFYAGEYLERSGGTADFLNLIPIRFTMSEATHYHVPLLLSPYSFSTYRGS